MEEWRNLGIAHSPGVDPQRLKASYIRRTISTCSCDIARAVSRYSHSHSGKLCRTRPRRPKLFMQLASLFPKARPIPIRQSPRDRSHQHPAQERLAVICLDRGVALVASEPVARGVPGSANGLAGCGKSRRSRTDRIGSNVCSHHWLADGARRLGRLAARKRGSDTQAA
jgi:hypothetical protein